MTVLVRPARSVAGRVRVPGDKSISHRALILGALARGETRIHGLLDAADVRSTVQVLAALGAGVEVDWAAGEARVLGFADEPREPGDVLDAGNSGTTARLVAGVLAGQPLVAVITGDASLRRRPMDRISRPLAAMGASILGRQGASRLPLVFAGGSLAGGTFRLPVASAQVKSALLLAGLRATGETWIEEPGPSRDHTERMLAGFGAEVERKGNRVGVAGGQSLRGCSLRVPGDLSAAAFFLGLAAALPGAEVTVEGVGLNPTRTGFLEVLAEMGAAVEVTVTGSEGGEPSGQVTVRGSGGLAGVRVEGERVPRMIDEFPILAVIATRARGRTEVRDAAELRVKESDRIAAIATELGRLGVRVETAPDGFAIDGPQPLPGGHSHAGGDHRMAMALSVAGALSAQGVAVEGAESVAISFPGFFGELQALGVQVEPVGRVGDEREDSPGPARRGEP